MLWECNTEATRHLSHSPCAGVGLVASLSSYTGQALYKCPQWMNEWMKEDNRWPGYLQMRFMRLCVCHSLPSDLVDSDFDNGLFRTVCVWKPVHSVVLLQVRTASDAFLLKQCYINMRLRFQLPQGSSGCSAGEGCAERRKDSNAAFHWEEDVEWTTVSLPRHLPPTEPNRTTMTIS